MNVKKPREQSIHVEPELGSSISVQLIMAWLVIIAVQGYFVVCQKTEDKESRRPKGTSPLDVSQDGTDRPMMPIDSNS